jgi:hypothetical protein
VNSLIWNVHPQALWASGPNFPRLKTEGYIFQPSQTYLNCLLTFEAYDAVFLVPRGVNI